MSQALARPASSDGSELTAAIPPILIGGCPRSGTTLLGAILGHGQAALTVPESGFKWELLGPARVGDSNRLNRATVTRSLERDWRFRLWGIATPELTEGEPEEIAFDALLDQLVHAHGATVGKPHPDVWIDHTPGNIKYAMTLAEMLPEARFVHLIRDGRAVAASVLPLDWGPNNVFEAATWWASHVAMGLAAARALGPERVLTVRFEDILTDGARTVSELCNDLDLTFHPEMLHRREYRVQQYTKRQHRLISEPPDTSRTDAWRTRLSTREVETFEYLTGELLAYLGYPLVSRPPAPAPSTSDHVRDVARGLLRRQLLDKPRRLLRRRRGVQAAQQARSARMT